MSTYRDDYLNFLDDQLVTMKSQGLYKVEEPLTTPQAGHMGTVHHGEVINLCSNNYLGLADDPRLINAAHAALDKWGHGMASVRFICGTNEEHLALERELTEFLHPGSPAGEWDTILYSSCFDANGGLFETLFTEEDAIISDALNHASIIDGVRLSKARRFRYANADMADLEAQLQAAADARFKVIATDGVFSMDGVIAPLPQIVALAKEYGALIMVDDSHAVGVLGPNGAGTAEHYGVSDDIDILTGTLGKALGGASGGYTCARKPIVDILRQRSRPYLFSNSLMPAIVGSAREALKIVQNEPERRQRLKENAAYFRTNMEAAGFTIAGADHPICPVMIGDANKAAQMADKLLQSGIYVRAFSFPVVPRGQARIRTQMNAVLDQSDCDKVARAFETCDLKG